MIKLLKDGKEFYFSGHMAKSSLLLGLVYMLFGGLMSYGVPSGWLMIMVGVIWVAQVLFSVNATAFVKSSPRRKELETKIPALLGFVGNLITYAICIIFICLQSKFASEQNVRYFSGEVILIGVFVMVLCIFAALCYKGMIVATILFAVAVVGLSIFATNRVLKIFAEVPLPVSIVIGLVEIVIGAMLQYGVGCLLYKLPLSKYAQSAKLRKLM